MLFLEAFFTASKLRHELICTSFDDVEWIDASFNLLAATAHKNCFLEKLLLLLLLLSYTNTAAAIARRSKALHMSCCWFDRRAIAAGSSVGAA